MAASPPAPLVRACWAGRAWRRSTQVRTVRMSAPSIAAAWSRGASSAWARSVQWDASACTAPGPVEPTTTSERAVVRAVRHEVHAGNGDHRSRCTPGRSTTDPDGSKRWHVPSVERVAMVASSTSGFVEVVTTAPAADNTLGMSSADVLPERGGPSTSTECCPSA